MSQIPTLAIGFHGAPSGNPATPADSVVGGEIGAFAALFAHFRSMQGSEDPTELTSETAAGNADGAGVTALLAALGLSQPALERPDNERIDPPAPLPEATPDILAPSGVLLGLPAASPPPAAISAVDADASASQSLSPRPLPFVAVPPEAADGVANGDATIPVSEPKTASVTPPSPGREFAATLTEAIQQAHETSVPGSSATVVQQVIAEHSPAHADSVHENWTISKPAGAPGWSDEIGNRIVWMASQGRSQAELVLNPPHLGRIEVNLTLNGDQAAASFTSSNPVVRELLEAALPRLREALADAGIQLGQTQVGAEHPRQQAQQEKYPAADSMRSDDAKPAIASMRPDGLTTRVALKFGRGLVDVFA